MEEAVMSTAPARRGRPSKRSEAEMELVALRGAIMRTVFEMAPAMRRQTLRASWHGGAAQEDARMRSALARLTKAAMAPDR